MSLRKSIKKGILILSLLAATKFAPLSAKEVSSQTLEEKLHYNINCITKIGDANFKYEQEGNKYTININAETGGIITTSFLNRKYEFKTEGYINNKNFFPLSYTFMNKGRDGYNSIEVIQVFDFENLVVKSKRKDNCKNLNYNKNSKISLGAKDIFSAIMEMRTKKIQDEAILHIIESGEEQKYNIKYEGRINININKKDYSAHKFSILSATGKIGKLGKEAVLYLSTNEERTPLRLTLKDYLVGYVNIELNE